ncbi:MAG: hypothetical protein H7A45_03260 [Verrucomicrobiales bacterium]|nr:hypothetical protein [Verrucomicrobiales bacterium]MCP5527788.1 hypothetical protein [Verrucomicrobiales bacterium]
MKTRQSPSRLATVLILTFGLNLHGASTLQFEYSPYTATEGDPSVLVAVVRTGDLTGPASVEVESQDVTATAGEDYEATGLTLEFAAGEDLRTFRVPLLNDGAEEADERFRLRLTNPSEGSQLGRQYVTIVVVEDNDPGVQFTWGNFWAREDGGELTVTVERGNDADLAPFTVDYATSDLTAQAGLDYTAISGTLHFEAGEMTRTVEVVVLEDDEVEARERFQMALSASTGPGGLGEHSTADLWVQDSTGNQPRRFGGVHFVASDDGASRLEASLTGRHGGNDDVWYELLNLESSADLATWQPEAWMGVPAPEMPGVFQHEFDPLDPSGNRRFFRLNAAALQSAWPPPESAGCTFATDTTAVGYTERWLMDPTRRNRHGISDKSTFCVSIWYPGLAQSGVLPRRLITAPELHIWLAGWDYREGAPGFDVLSHAFPDIPFDDRHAACPVILFSHTGAPYAGSRTDMFHDAECLARAGYVVVAPDHYDMWATPLEDGTMYWTPTTPDRTPAGFADRVRDCMVIIDALADWQASDPILAGRLDPDRLAAIGMSWGASVAAELCRTVENCRAGIGITVNEWCLTGAEAVMAEGPGKPFMVIQPSNVTSKLLYTQASENAVWLRIAHTDYDSLSTWAPYWNHDPAQGLLEKDRAATRTLEAYEASFLKEHLKGETDPLWQAPSDDYPNVLEHQRK